MDEVALFRFLANAHRNTYAATKETRLKHRMSVPFLPGHKCYYYKEGDWEYYDGYAGIQWAPGREVVLFKANPIWAMSYQGKTTPGYSDELYEQAFLFLKSALRSFDDAMPFRGPTAFAEGDFAYAFQMKGDYSYFLGRESITFQGKEIFYQDVMGSIIK
jgi:hypothetical protein